METHHTERWRMAHGAERRGEADRAGRRRIARSGGESLGAAAAAAAAVGAAETWADAVAVAADCEIEIARFAARLTGGFALHCTASLVLRHPSPR